MSDQASLMKAALKSVFVPALRERGFKGSFPHFHRVGPTRVDFLSVQFHSAGGSFVVEIAQSGPQGTTTGHGKDLPVAKINVQYFSRRLRLGSDPSAGITDHWFAFGPRNYEAAQAPQAPAYYEHIALGLVPRVDTQAEAWWLAGNPVAV